MQVRLSLKQYTTSQMLAILVSTILVGCSNGSDNQSDNAQQPLIKESYSIDVSNVVAEIQPTMYGIFFEDINFAADGGLYAEMIKNRSFEFDWPLMGWEQPKSDRFSMNDASGFASVIKRSSGNSNAHYLRVTIKSDTGYVLTNSGYRGMGVSEGKQYDLTLQARVLEGQPNMKINFVDGNGKVLGGTRIQPAGRDWQAYAASFNATANEMSALFRIEFEGIGVVDLDMISLFPADTWKGRPKGLRKDLAQKLADMKPGFLRFPGGCIVEGSTLSRRYQWKKTVNDIEDRETLINRWNTEFKHRLTPDYYQSFGLGFFEYFQLAEDMDAEPLPILSCGMACQFNTGELVPLGELDPYVSDALDLIEFANGDVNSTWGKVRAAMGHPEPFNMKMIGIGNEQWGPEYISRYKMFEQAIKAKYPNMIIVSGSGPFPDGEMFEYGWKELKKLNAEIVDEHYYRDPEWFLKNANRYDGYDRDGPKVFAGEYAAQSVAIASPDNKNNWNCALSEAAFMTGLERNAEVVHMTSYAPLFAHADGWQWTPDLIWFNNLQSYGTPNYYVQKLFSTNRGTHVLDIKNGDVAPTGQNGLYASAAKDEEAKQLIVKIVNVNNNSVELDLNVSGASALAQNGKLSVLSSNDPDGANSFESPEAISPIDNDIAIEAGYIKLNLKSKSLSVFRISIQQ